MPNLKQKLSTTEQQVIKGKLLSAQHIFAWQNKTEQYCAYRLDGLWHGHKLQIKQYQNGTFYLNASSDDALVTLCQVIGLRHSISIPPQPVTAGSQPERYIGTDESGKGDYFGPLVAAGVLVTPETLSKLPALGVKDSKKLSDREIADTVQALVSLVGANNTYVACLMPEVYNVQYQAHQSNLNILLAWLHAHVMRQLLNQTEQSQEELTLIVDQFGPSHRIESNLKQADIRLPLICVPKAEDQYIGVAAASILARHQFVKRIHALSTEWGMTIPLGAGPPVKKAKAAFIARHGQAQLNQVAKLHFKV